MAYYPNKGEEPGNTTQTPFGAEAGDSTIEGTLRANGESHFYGVARFHNTIEIDDGQSVDVFAGTTYTYADPLLRLNTSFTGSYVTDAGIAVYRGAAYPDAQVVFSEAADHSTYAWRAGVVGSMLRLATIADDVTDRHALFWDVNRIASHPNLVFNASLINSGIPFLLDIPAGGATSTLRYNESIARALSIERYNSGALSDSMGFGFGDTTINGTAYTGIPMITAGKTLIVRVSAPTDSKAIFAVDGVASIGLDDATTAVIRTDLAALHVDATTTLILGAGNVQAITATSTAVNILLPLTTQSIDATSVEADSMSSLSYRCLLPSSPIPFSNALIGIQLSYSYSTPALQRYVLRIDYEITSGAGENYDVYAPIKVSLDAIRNIRGVVRRLVAGSVVQVYGLPATDISAQAPFDLSFPMWSTLAGYSFLRINIVKVIGVWSIMATIEYEV